MKDLPIKNGGRGPAFNITGAVHWSGTAGGGAAIEPRALAAGEETTVALVAEGARPNLNNARVFLRYTDSAGTEWQTHFAFAGTIGLLASPQLRVDLVGAGATADLGEPQYNAEAWVNAPPAGALRWGATTRRSSDVGAWLGRGIEGLGRRIQNRWGSRPKL